MKFQETLLPTYDATTPEGTHNIVLEMTGDAKEAERAASELRLKQHAAEVAQRLAAQQQQ